MDQDDYPRKSYKFANKIPFNIESWVSNSSKAVIKPNSFGIDPETDVAEMLKLVNLMRFPIQVGIVPVTDELPKFKYCNWVKLHR